MNANADCNRLIEHFFRHEYGRLVAALTQRLGLRRIDLAEDVAQSALSQAIKHWSRKGIPDNPGGWLYRVAIRLAIDVLRRESLQRKSFQNLRQDASLATSPSSFTESLDQDTVIDDQLQLLLACCAPELSLTSSIALALKVMCGFSTAEIAHALLSSESNIQRRVTRAKETLRGVQLLSDAADISSRIEAASMVIYLLFNEGYLSSHNEVSIRRELCVEAKRLATLVSLHPQGNQPYLYALLALICFHTARLDARADATGEVLLLDRQDRERWDWDEIREGMDWMQRSASGTEVTRFHIEASIAWEHCRVRSFADTNWPHIRHLYDLLLQRVSSPAQWLNRAIAEMHCGGSAAALRWLDRIPAEDRPADYPLWFAVLGYLHFRNNDLAEAERQWQEALSRTHSRAEQELLRRRIASCKSSGSHRVTSSHDDMRL